MKYYHHYYKLATAFHFSFIFRPEESVDHNILRHINATGGSTAGGSAIDSGIEGPSSWEHESTETASYINNSLSTGNGLVKRRLNSKQRHNLRKDIFKVLEKTRQSEDILVRLNFFWK